MLLKINIYNSNIYTAIWFKLLNNIQCPKATYLHIRSVIQPDQYQLPLLPPPGEISKERSQLKRSRDLQRREILMDAQPVLRTLRPCMQHHLYIGNSYIRQTSFCVTSRLSITLVHGGDTHMLAKTQQDQQTKMCHSSINRRRKHQMEFRPTNKISSFKTKFVLWSLQIFPAL